MANNSRSSLQAGGLLLCRAEMTDHLPCWAARHRVWSITFAIFVLSTSTLFHRDDLHRQAPIDAPDQRAGPLSLLKIEHRAKPSYISQSYVHITCDIRLCKMAGSTPPTRASRYSQRSSLFSSPDRPPCADFLSPDRNSELSHKEALAAAAAEHTRIREKANHTLQLYQEEEAQRRLAERQQQLIDLQQKEKQRLEKERSLRAEDERLRDLRAKSIARLPPEPELPKAPTAPVKQEATPTPQPTLSAQPQASTTPATANGATPATQPAASAPATSILNRTPTPAANSPTPLSNPAQQQTTQEPAKSASPLQPVANGQVKPEQSPTNGTAPSATPAHVPPPAPRVDPLKQRYLDIHKNLKAFRASYVHQMSTNPALKNHTADLRRDVRKFVGQISMDKANNRLLVSSDRPVLL